MKLDEILPHISRQIKAQQWTCAVLAVSGGLDSICLAHYFICNKNALGLDWLGIVHIHHGLRKGSADLDAELVQNFAETHKVPFFLKKLDGSALKKAGGSLEENARDARYEALRHFAAENHADAILTAHHAGDQAETVYLRLRRGVSLAGLRGIQEVRPFEGTANANAEAKKMCALYRPFLNVTRKELADYARQNNLQWREDESNADVRFARNKIRHQSLPHLENLFPGAPLQLCKVAELAQKSYVKILKRASEIFEQAVVPPQNCPNNDEFSPYGKILALDLKRIPVPLLYSEIFRLWLETKGFRLAVNQSKACLPNPLPRHFRHKQIILEKRRNILWFYDLTTIKVIDNLYFVNDK